MTLIYANFPFCYLRHVSNKTDGGYRVSFVAGYSRASQPHRSRMAEDVRTILPQLHEKHSKQHGLEAATVAEHDLYLERGFVLITLVGQVSARIYAQDRSNILRTKEGNAHAMEHWRT